MRGKWSMERGLDRMGAENTAGGHSRRVFLARGLAVFLIGLGAGAGAMAVVGRPDIQPSASRSPALSAPVLSAPGDIAVASTSPVALTPSGSITASPLATGSPSPQKSPARTVSPAPVKRTPAPTPAQSITVIVTNQQGRRLAKIDTVLWSFGRRISESGRTGSDGTFTYGSYGLPPGTYAVSAEDAFGVYAGGWYKASGFSYGPMSEATTIVVNAGDHIVETFALPPAMHVKLTVRDTNGSPIKGVNCAFMNGSQTDATTNASGVCSVVVWPGMSFSVWVQDHDRGLGQCWDANGVCASAGTVFRITASSGDMDLALTIPATGS
jgi:hypothetical protein